MRPFKLENNARFSNRFIILFLFPVLFEQLMVAGLGIADTFMVSFLGETAVAGVALVSRIDNFAKQFFVALAQGGSVVLSQYIGAKEPLKSRTSLKNNIVIVVSIGLSIMLLMILFKNQVLNLFFGGAEKDVLAISSTYFTVTAFSYPFVALYYSCSASFRAMGESKVPFVASVIMMCINLVLKYIFIFKLDLGVTGAALSTLIAMAIVGFWLLFMLKSHHNKVFIDKILKLDFNKKIAGQILSVSVPNGIEQGMFQLGALLIAGLISGLGTAAIAADSIARSVSPLLHSMGTSFNAVMMTVVGQCMGAGKSDEAAFYTKHILKLNYLFTFVNTIIFLIILKPLISAFNVSNEAQSLAFQIMLLYSAGTVTVYPLSFALASALRGAADTKYVMLISTASMFLFRIGAAYIFVHALQLGVFGTWLAMVLDWGIRTVIFVFRFAKGKWKLNKVI